MGGSSRDEVGGEVLVRAGVNRVEAVESWRVCAGMEMMSRGRLGGRESLACVGRETTKCGILKGVAVTMGSMGAEDLWQAGDDEARQVKGWAAVRDDDGRRERKAAGSAGAAGEARGRWMDVPGLMFGSSLAQIKPFVRPGHFLVTSIARFAYGVHSGLFPPPSLCFTAREFQLPKTNRIAHLRATLALRAHDKFSPVLLDQIFLLSPSVTPLFSFLESYFENRCRPALPCSDQFLFPDLAPESHYQVESQSILCEGTPMPAGKSQRAAVRRLPISSNSTQTNTSQVVGREAQATRAPPIRRGCTYRVRPRRPKWHLGATEMKRNAAHSAASVESQRQRGNWEVYPNTSDHLLVRAFLSAATSAFRRGGTSSSNSMVDRLEAKFYAGIHENSPHVAYVLCNTDAPGSKPVPELPAESGKVFGFMFSVLESTSVRSLPARGN
ncbi:hypothetical protein B0H14DRAFT_2620484 [Mycena olivaceomarginata]|nr:hypothetical protein B0H14DRAFT_2620484 [Mycena olivaceomarginata]